MSRKILWAGILAFIVCLFGRDQDRALAQPCQWNYSMQPGGPAPGGPGVATATYCGNANVNGNMTVSGSISGSFVTTAFPDVPTMQGTNGVPNQAGVTSGTQGGTFVFTTALCNNAGAGDGGTQFPSTSATPGCWRRQIPSKVAYNVMWFGAQCMGVQISDGVSTNGSAIITSTSAKWGNVKPGWIAVVNNAAASGFQLVTTVLSVQSPSQVTLATNAGANGTAETISLYPDDLPAFQAANTAATADNAWLQLPSNGTCGFRNPGSTTTLAIGGLGLDLNNGTLWLGQTGPTIDTGVTINLFKSNQVVTGPGTIDGLYQNGQQTPQFNLHGLIFQGAGMITNNAVVNHVTIGHTKAVGIFAYLTQNLRLIDFTINNAGDSSFQNSSTPGDMAGRSMCITIDGPQLSLLVKNFVTINCAQSGILVADFNNNPDPQLHVVIEGCQHYFNGYYGVDIEQVHGQIHVSDCHVTQNGVAPTGVLIQGGFQERDNPYIDNVNVSTQGSNTNAFVMITTGLDGIVNWGLHDFNLIGFGTGNTKNAQLYVGYGLGITPRTRVTIDHGQYDFATFQHTAAPVCAPTAPRQQLFQFDHINASQLSSQAADTQFLPAGIANELVYVLGSDSNLGNVNVTSTSTSTKFLYLDLMRVQMNGTPTLSGVASLTYATIPGTNPQTSFVCP